MTWIVLEALMGLLSGAIFMRSIVEWYEAETQYTLLALLLRKAAMSLEMSEGWEWTPTGRAGLNAVLARHRDELRRCLYRLDALLTYPHPLRERGFDVLARLNAEIAVHGGWGDGGAQRARRKG